MLNVRKKVKRLVGVIMCLCLLIGALYVPVSMSAYADSQTTVFDFSDTVTDNEVNMNEALNNGAGYFGWGPAVTTYDGNKVLSVIHSDPSRDWPTSGGYRLHSGTELYRLDTDTTYVVSMKVKVLSGVKTTKNLSPDAQAVVSLGWGAYYNPSLSGNAGNYVNRVGETVVKVVTSNTDSEQYSLTTGAGVVDYPYGDEWRTVTYRFTTPSDFGNYDNVLSLWSTKYYGFSCYIADVTVTKLSKNQGIVIAFDEYSGSSDVYFGDIGSTVSLPDISSSAKQPEHIFEGWYADADRTQAVTEATYKKEEQTVYSLWDAPVSYTFKNTLSGKETVVEGKLGEAIQYPADPVDENGQQWFVGWYTTEACTEEFKDKTFGYSDKTVYSSWKSEVPGYSQDFENYVKHLYQVTDTNGVKRKSNRLYFGETMSRQSEVTYDDSGYAIRFDWDSTMVKVDSDANTYDSNRYGQMDMYIWLGSGLENKTPYVATFMFKAKETKADINFYLVSATDWNIWGTNRMYSTYTVKSEDITGEWQQGTIAFTTNFANDSVKTMYLGVTLSENADVELYIDNVHFESQVQPYQSMITVNNNNGDAAYEIIGNRGDVVEIADPVHPTGAQFKGWYLDRKFTIPAEEFVINRVPYAIYAKWGVIPITFENYPYTTKPDNSAFGKLLSIDSSGLGINDDYALRFKYNGSDVYGYDENGDPMYMVSRATQLDQIAQLSHAIKNDTVYKVTLNYKVLDSNCNIKFRFFTGLGWNIWAANDRSEYVEAAFTAKAGVGEWQTVTTYFHSNIKGSGNYLYILFNVDGFDSSEYADVLIDNVKIEQAEAPYAVFDLQNGGNKIILDGNVGESISYPAEPENYAKTFKGWYSDKEGTVLFTDKTFTEGMEAFVYAGYDDSNVAIHDFENYSLLPAEYTPGFFYMEDSVCKFDKTALSGKNVLEFDRTGDFNGGGTAAGIAYGGRIFRVDSATRYIITFNVRVTKKLEEKATVYFTSAASYNLWANVATLTNEATLDKDTKVGEWKKVSLVLNSNRVNADNNSLFMRVMGGNGGIIQFDDVIVTAIPEGYGAVAVMDGGCDSLPKMFIGKIGESYANKLPKSPVVKETYFKGYYFVNAVGLYEKFKEEDMKFKEELNTVYARFYKYETVQTFDDNDYASAAAKKAGLSIYDFDYEIYDATKEGNSKENVTSGNYSLHRKGESRYFESAALLTFYNKIAEGERYTVTFKVKMGKHLHTDGAIKIASARNPLYSWSTTGDWYPVVAIKDLADGQWHEVSYTFNSVENFVSIQTPGYVELFIDDVKFSLRVDDVPLSTPIVFTEYVQAERDEKGNIIGAEDAIDVKSIVDVTLQPAKDNFASLPVIFGVAGGCAVAIAAVVIFIIIKKKKSKKA